MATPNIVKESSLKRDDTLLLPPGVFAHIVESVLPPKTKISRQGCELFQMYVEAELASAFADAGERAKHGHNRREELPPPNLTLRGADFKAAVAALKI